ncbi:hypothetical protein HYALB_00003485 [Hymenoscyphus albidus]|uniref:Uncharacterized protein n=1 Tax=Hymenoscyphus albidus TaxID=595503 RepID=A0A9N9Q6E7_9HELO|nr:hypothetical protein HYALB_00003485 [Hymenoscyphus albidus]
MASWNSQYGYSVVVAGFRTGITLGEPHVVIPVTVDAQDQALAIGSKLSFRILRDTWASLYLELDAVQGSTRSILLLSTELQKDVARFTLKAKLTDVSSHWFCGACSLATALM